MVHVVMGSSIAFAPPATPARVSPASRPWQQPHARYVRATCVDTCAKCQACRTRGARLHAGSGASGLPALCLQGTCATCAYGEACEELRTIYIMHAPPAHAILQQRLAAQSGSSMRCPYTLASLPDLAQGAQAARLVRQMHGHERGRARGVRGHARPSQAERVAQPADHVAQAVAGRDARPDLEPQVAAACIPGTCSRRRHPCARQAGAPGRRPRRAGPPTSAPAGCVAAGPSPRPPRRTACGTAELHIVFIVREKCPIGIRLGLEAIALEDHLWHGHVCRGLSLTYRGALSSSTASAQVPSRR